MIPKEADTKTMVWEVKGQGRMVNSMVFLQMQINHKDSPIKCEITVNLTVDPEVRLLSMICKDMIGIRGWEVLYKTKKNPRKCKMFKRYSFFIN